MRLATQIIDSLEDPWKPETYRDTFTEKVRNLIRAHDKGQDVVVEEAPAARTADVVELMTALEASLEVAKSRKGRDEALSDEAERMPQEAEVHRPRPVGDPLSPRQRRPRVAARPRSKESKSSGTRAPAAKRKSAWSQLSEYRERVMPERVNRAQVRCPRTPVAMPPPTCQT